MSAKGPRLVKPHQRFAQEVLAAFEKAGRYTDESVKAAGGPSSSTMTKIRAAAERGEPLVEPRGDTCRRIEAAAGWPDGTTKRLWRTGELKLPPDLERLLNVPTPRIRSEADFLRWVSSAPILSDEQRTRILDEYAQAEPLRKKLSEATAISVDLPAAALQDDIDRRQEEQEMSGDT